jgi:hypothetical protein
METHKKELQMTENEFPSIVERRLVLHDISADSKRQIRLVVGCPYWTEPEMEAACPVAIYGYLGRLADIHGIDPMGALTLAIKFLDDLLEGLPENLVVYWPSGDPYHEE